MNVTMMADQTPRSTIVERIEWLVAWEAECTVRIHQCPMSRDIEVLFKHSGTSTWHECVIKENEMRYQSQFEALAPLRALVRLTKP